MASSLSALLAQMKKLQQGAPYDASLATALQTAQRRAADLDRSYTMGKADVEKGYGDITRDLGIQRGKNVINTKGRYADTGLFHSGIHATAQGEVEQDYQTGMSEAAQRRLQGFRGLDEARLGGETGIQDMLLGAQQDYSRRQSEAAQTQAAAKAQAAAQAQQNAMAQQAAASNAAMMRAIIGATGGGGGGGGGLGAAPANPWVSIAQKAAQQKNWSIGLALAQKQWGAKKALEWAYKNPFPHGTMNPVIAAQMKKVQQAAAMQGAASRRAGSNRMVGMM